MTVKLPVALPTQNPGLPETSIPGGGAVRREPGHPVVDARREDLVARGIEVQGPGVAVGRVDGDGDELAVPVGLVQGDVDVVGARGVRERSAARDSPGSPLIEIEPDTTFSGGGWHPARRLQSWAIQPRSVMDVSSH